MTALRDKEKVSSQIADVYGWATTNLLTNRVIGRLGLLPIWLTIVTACASGPTAPTSEAYVSAVFARIQLHEAALDRAAAQAERADTETIRTESTERARRATAAICNLAKRVRDPDALARCERAKVQLAASAPAPETAGH